MGVAGIYLIKNSINGRMYVGSSVNLWGRYKAHKSALINNKHHCIFLQRDYNKCGDDAFEFELQEIGTPKEELVRIEQHWIDDLKDTWFLYNTCPTAGSCLGTKQSAETKEKRAAKVRGIPRPHVGPAISAAKRGVPLSEAGRKAVWLASQKRRITISDAVCEEIVAELNSGEAWFRIADRRKYQVKLLRREITTWLEKKGLLSMLSVWRRQNWGRVSSATMLERSRPQKDVMSNTGLAEKVVPILSVGLQLQLPLNT